MTSRLIMKAPSLPSPACGGRRGGGLLRADIQRGDIHHIRIKPRHEARPLGAREQHFGAVGRDRREAVKAVVKSQPYRLAAFEIAEKDFPVRWIVGGRGHQTHMPSLPPP